MAILTQEIPRLKTFLPVLILTGLLVSGHHPGNAQEAPGSLIKAGYLPIGFSKFYDDQYSLNLEYEGGFKKAGYLSHGAGYDLNRYSQNEKHNFLRYNLRFYPFFWVYGKRPYRGLYLGVSPAFQWRNYAHAETQYGIGLIPTLGYQFMIKDKISMAFDMNMAAYRDMNENATYSTGDEFNYGFYYSFKVGLKLGGRKNK